MAKKIAFILLIIGLFELISITGCKKMPNDGVPIYVLFDSTRVDITDPKQGTAHQKILDVWVEAGAENRGAYELPRAIPILQSGKVRVLTFAGIADNGDDDIRVKYPFLRIDTFTLYDPILGDTVAHNSVYRYYDDIDFWTEGFEVSSKFTNVNIAANNGAEGNAGGQIMFQNDTTAYAYQTNPYTIHLGGKGDVYVELEYKFDIPVEVGMKATKNGSTTDLPLMVINEKANWNKIYLNFSYLVGYNQADTYQLYFKSTKDKTASPTLLVDNIKILNFQP